MAQTSVQYTPVQVLQAARRAEAEGKMDYALQFYRHIVEHHGTTAEAQEAREGLFRIAEWRWGEARVARRQEAANGYGGQRAAAASAKPAFAHEPIDSAPPMAGAAQLPQIIARESARATEQEAPEADKPRYRAARFIALLLGGVGWVGVLIGAVIAGVAAGGGAAEVAAESLLGLPLGVVLGMPIIVIGLVLIVAGQLAIAVFESTNATLELLAIERSRSKR